MILQYIPSNHFFTLKTNINLIGTNCIDEANKQKINIKII